MIFSNKEKKNQSVHSCHSFRTVLDVGASTIKKVDCYLIELKEKVKLPLFSGNMIIYVENPKNTPLKLY